MEDSYNNLINKHVLIEIVVPNNSTLCAERIEVEGIIIRYEKLAYNTVVYVIIPANGEKCFPHYFPSVSLSLKEILEIWEP